MKSKGRLLKSSLMRRLLSMVMAVALVIGLLPVSALAAGSATRPDPTYTRRKPEVGILNAYTGTSAALYKEIRNAANSYSYWPDQYDAFPALFHTLGTINSGSFEWDSSISESYADSTLRELSKVYGNLEVNISATFKNDTHTHTHAKGLSKYKYTITDYEKVYLQIGPYTPVYLTGVYPETNKDATKPMIGEYDGVSNENMSSDAKNATDSYGIVRYSNDTTFQVNFVGMDFTYDHFGDLKTCTCNNTSADFPMMTFRDARAPQVAGVFYSLDGGTTWTQSTAGLRVKEGSTLEIKLHFDEPIRFVDDSKAGKGDLYLELQADGTSAGYENRKAYLTKLDGNDLYFSYTFSEPNVDWNIQTLNLSSLFGTGLKLVQVNREGSFTPRYVPTGDTTGFTATTCYITDLAGNALATRTVPSGDLNLDSERPYLKNVQFDLSLNNTDVKEALNKTDPSDTDYTDPSDLYLGVGDTVSLVLNMNERLKIDTLINDTAVATTNIIDGNGAPVTVRSRYFSPQYDWISGDVTSWVMNPITMQAGWTVDDEDGYIKVTALRFEGDSAAITDLAGNALDKNHVTIDDGANANPPWLDVTAPTVTDGGETQVDALGGFYYKVSIADTDSGYAGLNGEFILRNGTGGDGTNYPFQYAVNANGNTPSASDWKDGVTGTACSFEQVETVFIYIRPKDGVTYVNLSDCTLTVRAKDFAGNVSDVTLPSSGALNWYIDNQAPTVTAGETKRALKSNPSQGGILTVNFTLADSHGISKWDYAWTVNPTAPDPNDEQAWNSGALNSGEMVSTSLTKTLTEDVTSGETFSKYLWVKATDNSNSDPNQNNASDPICLGLYTYDLSEAQYNLDYSPGITQKASMKVSSVGADDTLVFLVKGKTDSVYALLRVDASITGEFEIFSLSAPWNYGYTCTESTIGHYTLTQTTDSAAQDAVMNTMISVYGADYSGELEVVILSGKTAAVTDNIAASGELTLGDESQFFSKDTATLKAAGTNVDSNYAGISVTSDSEPNSTRSTLAGIKLTISIAEDLNDWGFEGVNWAASYIEMKDNTIGSTIRYKIPLGPFQKEGNGITQTITIQEDSYASGSYYASLHLVCTANQNYTKDFLPQTYIHVDTTEPNNDFSLTSMTYTPLDYYGIEDFYGTLDCLGNAQNGVITLPVVDASCGAFGNGSPGDSYRFTISSPTELPIARNSKGYKLQMWNMADDTNKLTIGPTDSNQQTVQNNYGSYYTGDQAYGFVFDQGKVVAEKYLYLTPDQENIVAMQKVYSNGEKSEIKYIHIRPVTQHITGTMSVDVRTRELVFTPTSGISTVGAKVYAWAWQGASTSDGKRIDMTPEADGTWRCSLLESGAYYKVITVNSAGSIYDAGIISELAPKVSLLSSIYRDDGTYELLFAVRDDDNTIPNGITLDIGFNEAYAADHLGFTVKNGTYSWTETGVSSTGIYSVKAEMTEALDEDCLNVTVKGCFKNVTGQDTRMNITVTATDALGQTSAASTVEQEVKYQKPVIYDDNATVTNFKPKLGENGLILTFTQPVRPVDSWAWREEGSAVKGFQTQWEGAFPISGNGTYELQFVDIFGNTCSGTLTTNAFTVGTKDYSMDLTFSDSDLTSEPVTVTASVTGRPTPSTTNGYLTFWEGDGSETIWKKDGEYESVQLINLYGGWPEEPIHDPANGWNPIPEGELKDVGATRRAIQWETNGKMLIRYCTDFRYAENGCVYGQTVYIGNIAAAAPTADVRYFICALGEEFTQERLEQYIAENKDSSGKVTVTGNVEVWYKTTRSVTPTDGGSQYLFTPGGETSHTFSYVDDLNRTGSVTVNLSELGLTLQAPDGTQVDNDKDAPSVSVDIYTKISGSYTRAEAFTPIKPDDANYEAKQAELTQKFADLGYVQGYSLTVNASDASGYDIAVTGDDGAALSGNVVAITKAGTFTITVTDHSTRRNKTLVTFTVPAMIDNKAPEGSVDVTQTSLYEKTLTVTITDTYDGVNQTVNPAGENADTVTLSLPVGATRIGKNTYQYNITDNGTVEFVFFDLAGNQGSVSKSISGIDTDPPNLSVTWSPANPDNSDLPPVGPVNTYVTARIRSDKAMHGLTVQAGNETTAHDLLIAGVAQSYSILGQDNKPLVTFDVTPELVTVTYSENYYQKLTFTATAPNGKNKTLELSWVGSIDKTAPGITVVVNPQYRQLSENNQADVPYAVEVILVPDESVTSPNYGEMETVNGVRRPVQYSGSSGRPLVLTFTENGVYNVRFVDKAGNVTTVPVDLTASGFGHTIDNTAPELEVTTVEENNQVKVTVTANEYCKLTWEENGTPLVLTAGQSETITLTENGTYIFTAEDGAINKSYKTVWVYSIDKVAPSISFKSSTIYVMEDSSADALTDALEDSNTFDVWDNVTAAGWPKVSIDSSLVNLNAAGQYTVIYTVTDEAGNVTTANRFVRVIGKNTVCLKVDGKLILPGSTAVISPGEHTLTLVNNSEPYSIKARQGNLSAGQMKYLSGSSLSFDKNGKFSVTSTGYYTLLVTTQSRQTIRILLYVEQ